MRDLVRSGYERCARDYATTRDQFRNTKHLEDLARRLPDGACVLDLGCGSGRPVDAFLLERGFDVTGVDVSGEQIRLARETLPAGTFMQGDMSDVAFPAATFDAVVSFYAIFHIPREEHGGLLRRTWEGSEDRWVPARNDGIDCVGGNGRGRPWHQDVLESLRTSRESPAHRSGRIRGALRRGRCVGWRGTPGCPRSEGRRSRLRRCERPSMAGGQGFEPWSELPR
jgi:SAM-dependent methyltransferase